jgi:hypothetical protein
MIINFWYVFGWGPQSPNDDPVVGLLVGTTASGSYVKGTMVDDMSKGMSRSSLALSLKSIARY